jgi:SsrA-binding protein
MADAPARRVVAQNRRARFDYFIEDTLEAGIMLAGTEVKSLRSGQSNLTESYASKNNGELYLVNCYIPEYNKANQFNHETKRPRKLLLKKREMAKLFIALARKGMSVVPLAIYFNERGMAKVELGVASGKKMADKRQTQKDRDWQRDKSRLMRDRG